MTSYQIPRQPYLLLAKAYIRHLTLEPHLVLHLLIWYFTPVRSGKMIKVYRCCSFWLRITDQSGHFADPILHCGQCDLEGSK